MTGGSNDDPGVDSPTFFTVRRSANDGKSWETAARFRIPGHYFTFPTNLYIDRLDRLFTVGSVGNKDNSFRATFLQGSPAHGKTWKLIDLYSLGGSKDTILYGITMDHFGRLLTVGKAMDDQKILHAFVRLYGKGGAKNIDEYTGEMNLGAWLIGVVVDRSNKVFTNGHSYIPGQKTNLVTRASN